MRKPESAHATARPQLDAPCHLAMRTLAPGVTP